MTSVRTPPFLAGGGEMGRLITEHGWGATSLGPVEGWPSGLRTALAVCLSSRFPMLVWWGEQLVQFYNDACTPAMGAKHPRALGQRAAHCWAEAWDDLGPLAASVLAGHGATCSQDQLLLVERHGYVEESYWTFSYSPLQSETGDAVEGIFIAVNDTTNRVLGERRLDTLHELGEVSTAARPAEACSAVVGVLAGHPADLPFAALYLRAQGADPVECIASYGAQGTARAAAGVETVLASAEPLVSTGLQRRRPGVFVGMPGGVGDLAPDTAVTLPLRAGGEPEPIGALVLGVSPYRELDDDYTGFLELVAVQVAAVVSDASVFEAQRSHAEAEHGQPDREPSPEPAHERGERDRTEAQGRLERSEAAFRLLAEHSDDVIGRHDLDGTWRYVSPSVRRCAGYEPADLVGANPLDLVHSDDRGAVAAALAALAQDAPATVTVRFRHADGRWLWFEMRARLVRDERTGEVELHTSQRDVTERVLTEQKLSRFRALADSGGDFIAITGVDGHALYLNPAGRRMIGVDPERPAAELVMLDMVAPAERERFVVEVLGTVERTGSWVGEIDLVDGAGSPVPTVQVMTAHRDPRGRLEFVSTVAQDLRERRRADAALHAERERYRTLVEQVPVGIWVTDPAGATTLVNEHMAAIARATPEALLGKGWSRLAHPDDAAAAAAGWERALRAGEPWEHEHRAVLGDGTVVDVASSARPLRDATGAVAGFLGTTLDVTEQRRAELARREAAAEHAAREVADAAAARLRAMVAGLAAIVAEADWDADRRTVRFTFVSDRAEELLGYRADELLGDPVLWFGMIHPDERAEVVRFSLERIEAGRDHDLYYRAVAVDGRIVWLHQVVHVVRDADGAPARIQALAVDVTEQKRAQRSTELLAETGRLVADTGDVEGKLAELARLAMHDFGDGAIVSLIGPDGLARRAAVAHDDPDVERALLRLAPTRLPRELLDALAPGRPVLVPITEELVRAAGRDDGDAQARRALGARSALVVPLVGHGRTLGVLGFVNFGQPRHHDDAEVELAAELGRRASLMLQADRQRSRERHMRQISADLASAGSVSEAAQRLAVRLGDVLGAGAVSVHLVEPERGLRLVHATGYSPSALAGYEVIRFDDDVPIAEVVRTGEPLWIPDREQWRRRWPDLLPRAVAGERHAAAALPLIAGGRVVGAIGMSFATPRAFPVDEREFADVLVAQAAPAFERAATADERRHIAEILQTSLLPSTLPELDRLALAARYVSGAQGTAAGGDWYDVLPLDGERVAVAVGDVVGQGTRAAAVMGQLRSALSGYLLEGHDPARALERLDAFAGRVAGATGSTVACLVVDTGTGQLTWARAGHPPPLVVAIGGPRYLDDAVGTVLAVRGRAPFVAGHATLAPGESVVLYTDGLVERRDEVIDDGLDRLARTAASAPALAPAALVETLLAGSLAPAGPSDDVAVIVARLLPGPLRATLPAQPTRLRELRIAVAQWATATGIAEEVVHDLQLALGEAAANAVEHAYRDGVPGAMEVEVAREPGGLLRGRVRDHGSWRPKPADRGYRGRGLDLIRDVTVDMGLEHDGDGTEVRFVLPAPAAPARQGGAGTVPVTPPAATTLRVRPDASRVEILGDLDLAGVQAVRDELLALVGAADVTLDLAATTYLASAGVALLAEADGVARSRRGRLRLEVPVGGMVRRILQLAGLDQVVEVDAVVPGR